MIGHYLGEFSISYKPVSIEGAKFSLVTDISPSSGEARQARYWSHPQLPFHPPQVEEVRHPDEEVSSLCIALSFCVAA